MMDYNSIDNNLWIHNMKVAVISDTHVPKRAKDLPMKALGLLEDVDAIIHAGDIMTQSFLDRLKSVAPVFAVLGNNDLVLSLPEQLNLQWEGVSIGVIHDSGDKKGRGKRMRRLFPDADIVIFGHSHVPMNEDEDGLRLFNPGSPTEKRRQEKHTMGMLNLEQGKWSAEIIELD